MFRTIRNIRFFLPVKKIDRKSTFLFNDFVLDDFTEDIYFMHEELAQELETQYEMNRSIYEQIERWNDLFSEFQEFEVR